MSDPEAVVRLIRTNKQLRYDLASSLLRKIDGLVDTPQLPERVGRRNERKSPARNYGGFSEISSQDYVVAICLSMLDGTFDASRVDSEQLDVPLAQRTHGQHRGTARAMLFNNYGPSS